MIENTILRNILLTEKSAQCTNRSHLFRGDGVENVV